MRLFRRFTMTYKLLFIVALALLVSPAMGQIDLVNGGDVVQERTLSLFLRDSKGNQDWVREYDGRTFNPGIESYRYFGYDKGLQYRLDIDDLIIQDETVSFDLGVKNVLGLNLYTDHLTHRLDRTPPVNPFLEGTT